MSVFEGFDPLRLPQGPGFYRGKVRDILDYGSYLAITTTDRISAFDRVLGLVPEKGEILHHLSLFWFYHTQDILPNALVGSLGPRTALMKKAAPLRVEIIVRGYLTGSVLRDYPTAQKIWELPPGLSPHQKLPRPWVTPTTKSEHGHDEPISREAIIRQNLVSEQIWAEVEHKAIELYSRGAQLLETRGLILVDTKYEMGLIDGQLVLIDELHTPDSSRFWYRDSYEKSLSLKAQPRQLDKEVFRTWLLERGWKGEGEPPQVPAEVWRQVRERYLEAFTAATGYEFHPSNWTNDDYYREVLLWSPQRCGA